MRKPNYKDPGLSGIIRDTVRRVEVLERQRAAGAPYSIGEVADVTPPVQSAITLGVPGVSSITVTWTTDELAQGRLEYSLNSDMSGSSFTAYETTYRTSHTRTITGLSPSTTYYYRVISRDPSSNVTTSSIGSFTTASASSGGGGGTDVEVDFTGTNGAAWPSPFSVLLNNGGGSATIQGNRGRIAVGSVGGYGAFTSVGFAPEANDYEVTFDLHVVNLLGEGYARFAWRDVGATNIAWYAVEVQLTTGLIRVMEQDGSFTQVTHGSVDSSGLVVGDVVHFKVRAEGNSHKVRWWKNAATEPATWNVEFTDDTYASGHLHFHVLGGDTALAHIVEWDNVVVDYLVDTGGGGTEIRRVIGLAGDGGGGPGNQTFGFAHDWPRGDFETAYTYGNANSGSSWDYTDYETGLAILQTAATGADKIALHGYSIGGAFALEVLRRGETFGGRLVGVVIDDPAYHPGPYTNPAGTPVAMYKTERTGFPGEPWVEWFYVNEGTPHPGYTDDIADGLGVTAKWSHEHGGLRDHRPMTRDRVNNVGVEAPPELTGTDWWGEDTGAPPNEIPAALGTGWTGRTVQFFATSGPYGLETYEPTDDQRFKSANVTTLEAGTHLILEARSPDASSSTGISSGATYNQTEAISPGNSYIQAVMRMPAGVGYRPRFVLLPVDGTGAVVDVARGDGTTDSLWVGIDSETNEETHDVTNWFTIGVRLRADGTDWYLDGTLVHTSSTAISEATFPALMLQVVDPDGTTPFPSTFEISNVRVWTR